TADARSVETVVRLTTHDAWAEAAAAAPFCLAHLLALMDVRPLPASWPAVETGQVARLRTLSERLDAFAHGSAHDRRHLQTADERASVDEAADLLAGNRETVASPESGPASPATPGLAAVLLTGVFGSGKTTLAIELVERLSAAGVHAAAIDLDWLGWYEAPTGWDEHEDPRLTLEHLGFIASRYASVGVERFVIAGTIASGTRHRYAAAVRCPVTVVALEVSAAALRTRLRGDPNASRADDLARALERLEVAPVADDADWSIDADRPVGITASAVLQRLGWVTGDPARP
ncbi:MAG TPA: adenylyl-sulfate kinase, partial [Candidatus Limnocylindrales bacterium]|nr:adenylyl-sulfate kinase [Candidatus Limnocylindrales bacterium]